MLKFYKCNHCGNVVMKSVDSGADLVCCGEKMEELVPNSSGATTTHMPKVNFDGCDVFVEVGEDEHPMGEDHMIKFIVIDKGCAYFFKPLDPGKPAQAKFSTSNPKSVKAVYEYCNVHGLWVKEL